MRRFADRSAKSPIVASESAAACRCHLALERFLRCGHARRPIEIAIKSLGCAQSERAGPRARASDLHRDPWPDSLPPSHYIARLT
jgi:hypothetical protein